MAFLALPIPAAAGGWSEPSLLLENATHPSFLQDSRGTYWLASVSRGDIYLTRSEDGTSWSGPWKVTQGPWLDYRPNLMQDRNGTYWLAFFSDRTGNPDVFLMRSADGLAWSEPWPVVQSPHFDGYPYTLLQDSKATYWLGFISNRNGASKVFLSRSSDGVRWSEPVQVTSGGGFESFPVMVQDRGGTYWMAFTRQTGAPNKFDIFMMKSEDGLSWSAPVQVTRDVSNNNYISHITDRNGTHLIAFTSTRTGMEDVFVMASPDGLVWSEPQQLTFNAVNATRDYKTDYKSMIQDSGGAYWVAYHSVRGPEGIWHSKGRDVKFETTASVGRTPAPGTGGLELAGVIAGAAVVTLLLRRRP